MYAKHLNTDLGYAKRLRKLLNVLILKKMIVKMFINQLQIQISWQVKQEIVTQ